MAASIVLVCFVIAFVSPVAAREPLPEEHLLSEVLKSYNADARPAYNESKCVKVQHGFELLYLTVKEEHEGKMIVVETSGWLTNGWTDERLKWNPHRYSGIKRLSIPPEKVWIPDIVLYNNYDSLDSRLRGYLTVVKHTGEILWIPMSKLTVSCYHGGAKYTCEWKFGSWVHSGLEVDLHTSDAGFGTSYYSENPDWEISNTSATRQVVHYDCCPEPYVTILYKMTIRKKDSVGKKSSVKQSRGLFGHVKNADNDVEVEKYTHDLTHVLLLPTVIVSLLVPLQFLVPPESCQRITVLTILLVALVGLFFVLQGTDGAVIDSSRDLNHFYYASIIWVFAALLLSIFTLHICRWGHKRYRLPEFLRRVFLNCLGKIVCVNSGTGYDVMSASVSKDLVEDKPDMEKGSRLEQQMAAMLNLVKGLASYVMELKEHQSEWYLLVLVLDRLHCVTFLIIFVVYACGVLA